MEWGNYSLIEFKTTVYLYISSFVVMSKNNQFYSII